MVLGVGGRQDGDVFGIEALEEGRTDGGGGRDVDGPVWERRGYAAHGVLLCGCVCVSG